MWLAGVSAMLCISSNASLCFVMTVVLRGIVDEALLKQLSQYK